MKSRARITRVGPLLTLALAACSADSGKIAPSSEESTASVSAATTIPSFNVQVTLPNGVFVGDAPVAASGAVTVTDRDVIGGSIVSATGAVTIGSDGTAGGVIAGGNVTLHDRATVTGNIVAGGAITPGNSDTITGTSTAHSAVGTHTVTWTATEPSTSQGPILVQPGAVASAAPGVYDALTVNSRSSMFLQTGTYFFSSIDIEPGAQLFVDSSQGPVIVYVTGAVTYRGSVQSVDSGIPRLFVGYLGTTPVTLSAPFTGVFFAPSADVSLQPNNNIVSMATLYGKTVTIQPSAILQPFPFDFTVFGVPSNPQNNSPRPTVYLPRPGATTTANLPGDAPGNASASSNPSSPTTFTLPPSFPVAAGAITNGTVTVSFTPSGSSSLVTCTYKGGSSTALPTTATDLEAGRILSFVSCSDGKGAGIPRTGSNFTTTINRTSAVPVTVTLPLDDNACGHEFDLLSPADTLNMHDSFNWAQHQTPVAAKNTDGTPALYYAWIYVKNRDELLQIKKLYVHILNHPLFTQELNQYTGTCGTFRNPGDGRGIFVPVVLPGLVYNEILAIQTSNQVNGNRFPFDAVIIRTPPSGAANANGSISYAALRRANFHYLDAQPGQPLPAQADITLDGGVSQALTAAFTFLANAVQTIGHDVTNAIGAIDAFLQGSVTMDLRIRALNLDPNFNDTMPMTRGWGSDQGNPIGVGGLNVTLMENVLDFIPSTFMASTDGNGRVVMNAAKNSTRGSGICITLDNSAARISDFLTANEVCDFRGFSVTQAAPPPTSLGGVSLSFGSNQSLDIGVADGDMNEMVQSDDVHQYLSKVVGHNTKRARVLMGYWANTFSKSADDGTKRAFTPCLNFNNTLSDTIVAGTGVADLAASLVFPPAILAEPVLLVISSVLANSDIIMPTNGSIQNTREVGSHEYGHYSFCSMMQEVNGNAVDNLIFDTIFNSGADTSAPVRYINEAWADFISGQVESMANYRWLTGGQRNGKICTADAPNCYDENRTGNDGMGAPNNFGNQQIARVSTLIHDVFDGHGERVGAPNGSLGNVPSDADAWLVNGSGLVDYSPNGYGDQKDENVALAGQAILTLAHHVADGLGPLGTGPTVDDAKFYAALNQTMVDNGVGYCDRCQVFALHSSTGANPPVTRNDQLLACLNDPLIAAALGPAQTSTCGVSCPADAVIDGNTAGLVDQTFDVTAHAPNDVCPDVFVLEVDNPQGFFTKSQALTISGDFIGPNNQAACQTSYSLTLAEPATDGGASFVPQSTATATGTFSTCTPGQQPCLALCSGLPSMSFGPTNTPSTSFQFQTPNVAGRTFEFRAAGEIVIQ